MKRTKTIKTTSQRLRDVSVGEPRLRDLIYHHLAEWIKRQAKSVEKGDPAVAAPICPRARLE
jgi:hypothetical protein